MERIRIAKRILDFTPNFHSGVSSVLTPGRKSRQLRNVVLSMNQNDGLYEDWKAIGNDLRCAMSKFDTEMRWKRK